MTVSILSRDGINRLINNNELPSNTAIISFSDSEEEFVIFPIGTDVLQIAFLDITPFMVEKKMYDKILPEANIIAKYIHQKIIEGKDIICQCDYGVSRSAGCAAAILQMYGHHGIQIFADYRYSPNQFVYNKVLKELRKINKQ